MVDCFFSFGASRKALFILVGASLCFTKLAADYYMLSRSIFLQSAMMSMQETQPHVAAVRRRTTTTASTSTTSSYLQKRTVTKAKQYYEQKNKRKEAAPAEPSKYAYAFVIGGCNPEKPNYRGFVYNILVTARLLKDEGSTADIVAFFQLSNSYTDSDTLPDEDVKALEGLNVHIQYIPRSQDESFYETVLNKFRILSLTQYRRVLLLDGDVMPTGNLDFIFELSDDNKYGPGNSTLKQNVVVSGPFEPANAGFFMLTPGEGEYEHIQKIINDREERDKNMDADIKFNEELGWGHKIEAPDEWVSRKKRGRKWDFHFAFSDQGLLYHWTKYVKKDVSVIFQKHVTNWSEGPDGNVRIDQNLQKPFVGYSKPLLHLYIACQKFMCDFAHFSGSAKPWLKQPPKDLSEETKLSDAPYLWWSYLKKVDQEQGMGLDFDNWKKGQRPSLGLYASHRDMNRRLKQKVEAENNNKK